MNLTPAPLVQSRNRGLTALLFAAFIIVGVALVCRTYRPEYEAVGADVLRQVLSDPIIWLKDKLVVFIVWLACMVMLWRAQSSDAREARIKKRTVLERVTPLVAGTLLGLFAGGASVGWTLFVTGPVDQSLNALIGPDVAQTVSLAPIKGPIDEEPIKLAAALLILMFLARRGFSPWLAAVVGIAVGEGFTLVENLIYMLNAGLDHPYSTLEGAQQSAMTRHAFPGVGHWLCTGVSALGLAAVLGSAPLPSFLQAPYSTPRWRIVWCLGCIAAGTAGHALWNLSGSIVAITAACLAPFLIAFGCWLPGAVSDEAKRTPALR